MPVLIPGLLSSSSSSGGTVGDWPDSGDLEVTLRAAFGADLTADPLSWAFTDLSSRLVTSSQITVSRGLVVGQGTRKTASASGILLLNDDGALTPELVTSPWWPFVDLGTPMDFSIRTRTAPYVSDSFGRTVASGWGTADSGQAWTLTNGLSVSGGTARFSHSATNTIRTARIACTARDVDVTFTTSLTTVATGAAITVGPTLRTDAGAQNQLWPMLMFDTGGVVKLRVYSITGGVYSADTTVTVPGLTYAGGTQIRVRIRWVGSRLQCRAWLAAGSEPTTWTIDSTTLGGPQSAGVYLQMASWVLSANSNTLPNVVTVDDLDVSQPKYPRIEGFIADVRPSFRPLPDGTTHSVVQVEIGGIGSRLERRTADPLSPFRRSIEKYHALPPVDYWPLEDKKASTTAAHAFPGGTAMTASGPVVFEQDTGQPDDVILSRYGSTALCSVAAGAKLTAPTSLPGAAGSWGVSVTADLWARDVPGVTEIRILEWSTPSSSISRWALLATNTGHMVRAFNDAAGTATDVAVLADAYAGMLTYEVIAEQSGGNIDVTLLINAFPYVSGSIAGTCTQPTRITVNPGRVNTTGSTTVMGIRFMVGHLAIRTTTGSILPYYYNGPIPLRADRAWYQEPLHLRLDRLARVEEDIPFRLVADPDPSAVTLLNAQQEGGFVDLSTDAAEAESGGVLFEDAFGYAWLPRSARYNAPVALSVDMATYRRTGGTDPKDVLVPQLGNRGPNYWTIERRNGSQAVAAADKELRDRRGTVSDKKTLDLLYDWDCQPHAQWRTHLNVDGSGPHYPGMTLELHANPDLVDDWLLCTFGSRVQRLNQPTIAGVGVIDQVIDGITERFGARSGGGVDWTVTLDTSPAEVWDVGIWDTSVADSSSTTLNAARDATQTSWVFKTALPGDVWSTAEVPYPITVEGEDLTVTAMGAVSGTAPNLLQTATVVRSVNGVVKDHGAGAQIRIKSTDSGTIGL
uniref:hypothetical protein n=1 Tax=Paractinoplanes polyasparticus TaxID=2856853 RepID=UPI001C85D48F|nr:hypothetical protein [Actinoplanes polyasparticus]